MKFLFDASSMLQLIKSFDEEKTLHMLGENCILDLTKYEVGNALWKELVLHQAIEEDDFREFLNLLRKVVIRTKMLAVEPQKLSDVGRVAAEERITFYDASYIIVAKIKNLTLITEDGKLARAASKHTKTAPSRDIPSSDSTRR